MLAYLIAGHHADQTGFSEEDLELLWQSLASMFEHDRSAARGEMSTRGLNALKHDSKLGNTPAHRLVERANAEIKAGTEVPREFADYRVTVTETRLPAGVNLLRIVGQER